MPKIPINQFSRGSIQEEKRIVDDFEGDAPRLAPHFPLIVQKTSAGYAVLDGFHRLASGIAEKRRTMRVVVATPDEIASHRGAGEEGEQEWIDSVLRRARGYRVAK